MSLSAPEPFCHLAAGFQHPPLWIPGRVSARVWTTQPPPERSEHSATSVDGILQGLKLLKGLTDPSLLQVPSRPRRGRAEGYDFVHRTLSELEGRALLAVPVFLSFLEGPARGAFERLVREGRAEDVYVSDDSYAPSPFHVATALGMGRLVVDAAAGKLDGYGAAQATLRALAARVETDEPLEAADGWLSEVETALAQATEARRGLLDYAAWANAWLAEELMLLVLDCVGDRVSLRTGTRVLESWLRAGLVAPSGLDALARRAKAARVSPRWYLAAAN